MNIRIAALIFGILFLGTGLAWHIPLFFDNSGLMFGYFQVDPLHNKFNIGSGLLALAAAATSGWWCKLYFKLLGGVYVLLGILGFILSDQFMAMQINDSDSILHIVIGVVALLIGYRMQVRAGE